MSSTNRGAIRQTADFYATPPWVLDRLLDEKVLPAGTWLEAGAGDGALIKTTKQHPVYSKLGVRWIAAELRPETEPVLKESVGPEGIVHIGSYLTYKPPEPVDLVIANPPFAWADEFLHHARKHAKLVCFLLRLNYLQSGKRAAYLFENMPDLYILPDRPGFLGDGKTDSVAYAWLLWNGEEGGRREGKARMLATTPVHIRRPPRTKVLEEGAPEVLDLFAEES